MMGPAGRASGGPPAPPQSGWVGKQNYVWFRRVFSLFALSREMPRTSAFCLSKAKTIGPRVYDPTTFNPEA
jgi:hypothetical protein